MYKNEHNDLDPYFSGYFKKFRSKSGKDSKIFRRVSVEGLLVVEKIAQRNTFTCNFEIQEEELAQRSIKRFDNNGQNSEIQQKYHSYK